MRVFARYTSLLFILIGSVSLCFAQTKKRPGEQTPPDTAGEFNPASWKEYSPAEGGFSILFPGTPKVEVQAVEVQGGQFKVHVHTLKAVAEYGVIYADYPIPVDDARVAKAVLDNGVKGAVSEVNSELLSVMDISVGNHPGRLLRERLPNGNILRAKIVLVGQRLFQIAVTLPRPDNTSDSGVAYEEAATKFLDSFKLTGPAETPGEVDRYLSKVKVAGQAREGFQGTILDGGSLNGRAVSLPQPAYPPIAKAAGASGTVTVKVILDEAGVVLAAQVESGHPLLQSAALGAARAARFSPMKLDGKPVKVVGVLSYDFVLR